MSTVSSRALVFNNETTSELDDNGLLMIVPLLDFVNHSQEPNCIILPYHDRVTDQSYVILQTIRQIKKGDQLTISYGADMPNMNLVQKYGFTTRDNPNKKVVTNLPFHDYGTIAYEETDLKVHHSKRIGIPYSQEALFNAVLYGDKFSSEVLRQIRLTFLTSRCLMNNGGATWLDDKDFNEALDMENERMTFDFLIEGLEKQLNNLKPRDHYQNSLDQMPQVTSVREMNQMNLNVLHLDEHDVLTKNLSYLYKAREKQLFSL